MRGKRVLLTQFMKLVLGFLMYCLLCTTFFGLLSLTNTALLNLSRTFATTGVTFLGSLILLGNVYGRFDIGFRPKRSIFANNIITVFITDIITYFMLEIMNTNPNNPEANPSIILWGEDLVLLFCVFIIQIIVIYMLVSVADWLYYIINPPKKALIIASSQESAQHAAEKMAAFPKKFFLNEAVHYSCPDIQETIREHRVVFLADIPDTEEVFLEQFCYKYGRSVYLMAELEDVIISTATQNVLDDTPFLHISRNEPTIMQSIIKRMFDIIISFFALTVLSPVLLATSIVLKIGGNGSVIFRQKRATRDGRIFEIYKFRTMYENSPNESAKVNDERITPVGRILRKYRIDELPQLINVLRGDMSLVGPRPEMIENVDRYTKEVPEFQYRQRMKAGLTGLAQIEGKYNTTPKDKAILDLLYIENFSLLYDLKLLLRTLTVFFRHDSTEGFGARHVECPEIRRHAKTDKETCGGIN